MDEATWTVVQFLEDLTVEAIPTAWIQGEYCHWPPYKLEKLATAIKKCESINTNWPRHSIKIFRNGTFADYGKARNKARMAEDFSDLNSGNDEDNSKRKRIQRLLSSSSSSDDSMEQKDLKMPPPPKCPRSILNPRIDVSFNSSQDDIVSLDWSPEETEKCITKKHSEDQRLNTSTNTKKSNAIPSTLRDVNPQLTTNDSTVNENVTSTCCLQHENTILKEIKNQNHMIRGILVDVLQELRQLKNSPRDVEVSFFVRYSNINFPIGTVDEMDRFEEELQSQENFNGAVNELARYGGSNPYNSINAISYCKR